MFDSISWQKLSVLGVTPAQRNAASSAAASLAAAGVTDPPWAATIGHVEIGACWRLADVFGDQASLLSVFAYGRREHGLVALVDFNHLGGWVKDLFLTPEPARVLRELRKTARSEPFAVLDQVDPAEARRLLEDGLAATDATSSDMPSASLAAEPVRPRTAAACGAMPSSATSLPTRVTQTTLNGSNGSGALMTRPPSTRTQSMHLWLGSGSADQFASAG